MANRLLPVGLRFLFRAFDVLCIGVLEYWSEVGRNPTSPSLRRGQALWCCLSPELGRAEACDGGRSGEGRISEPGMMERRESQAFRFVAAVFGSGDCPTTPLVWRELKVGAELRPWRYRKEQSPFSSF
jgi:hypothetical protein